MHTVVPFAPGGVTDILARILNLPELSERFSQDGMTVVASTPEQLAEFLAREMAKYARVIEGAGIKGTL